MKRIVIFSSLLFLIISCRPQPNNTPTNTGTIKTIYLAGNEESALGGKAFIWKDYKIIQEISGGYSGVFITDMAVKDTNIFLTGAVGIYGQNMTGHLWKNGSGTPYTSYIDGFLNGIYLTETDVYAVGYDRNNSYISVAKTWKNGVVTLLSEDSYRATNAKANAVFVSGTDHYVAGYQSKPGKRTATIWKNGVEIPVTDGTTHSEAKAIFVSGSDVYTAGYIYINNMSEPALWKNGIRQPLAEANLVGGEANSVIVSASDVYVLAEVYPSSKRRGKLWKNGNLVPFFDDTKESYARAIAIDGKDIYVAGGIQNGTGLSAAFWKNGNVSIVYSKPSSYCVANAIIVK